MSILCKQLRNDTPLGSDRLREIAELVYNTDPYIYPAMFASRDEALAMIPAMFAARDPMFSLENLYVAEDGGRILGLILWIKGPMAWDTRVYDACMAVAGRAPSEHIGLVVREYFSAYRNQARDVISLINVCAAIPGQGIGSALLEAFLRDHPDPCELYVLADNAAAIRLYERAGFQVAERLTGFSVEQTKPDCLRMTRG